MSTISEHNRLIKVVLDGSKHLKHVLTNDMVNKMTMIEGRFPLSRLPVCGGCEKLAMYGPDGSGYCQSCGTITKHPITYSEYLASGFDVDETGETAKEVLKEQQVKRGIWLPQY